MSLVAKMAIIALWFAGAMVSGYFMAGIMIIASEHLG